jgi:AraC-like DNA-binding protein
MIDAYYFSVKEIASEYVFHDRKYYKLIILKKGNLLCMYNSKEKILTKNSVLIADNETELLTKQPADSIASYIVLSHSFLNRIISVENRRFIKELFYNKLRIVYFNENTINQIKSDSDKIIQEYKERKPAYMSVIHAKLTDLLINLYRSEQSGKNIKNPLLSIDDVIFYIKNNYADCFTLEGLAEKCGFNPSYFSRLFKNKTGYTVFEYINKIRIEKACMLLKRTNMSVIEIAYSTGYNNISFFNRYFRKLMNMSPKQYKNIIESS